MNLPQPLLYIQTVNDATGLFYVTAYLNKHRLKDEQDDGQGSLFDLAVTAAIHGSPLMA